ncbi:hypothetical protein ACHAXT_003948 [Thalassiosira profunda]
MSTLLFLAIVAVVVVAVLVVLAIHGKRRFLEQIPAQNTRAIYKCHAGSLSPGEPLPDGVPSNAGLMIAALVEATKPDVLDPKVLETGKMWKKEYEGEVVYMPYFEELVENEREWLEFFRLNSYHCMMTCRVLITLATVHCKRGGNNEQCRQMMDMHNKIFAIYRNTCARRGDPEEWCDNMDYRAQLNQFQLNCNLKRYKANVSVSRQLACYEAKYGMKPNHLSIFMARTGKRRPTSEEIKAVPRKEVLTGIMSVVESPAYKKFERKEEKRTKLLVCGHCGKREEGMKQFGVCPRCKVEVYCSRGCQTKAWKGHKKVCGQSKTNKKKN